MDPKVFKTYNSQLRILRSRGLIVPTTGVPKRILQQENYYKIINGYKSLFIDPALSTPLNEKYKVGSELYEIKALYDFDAELRSIFLKRILRIENNFGSAISYVFSEKYGHDNYLKLENFNVPSIPVGLTPNQEKKAKIKQVNTIQDIYKLIQGIQGDIARAIKNQKYIQHYMVDYGYIPMWVLINVLTFGTVSKFYRTMKEADQRSVAKILNVQFDELYGIIGILTLVRNTCAHDERLFDFISHTPQLKTNYIHTNLSIPLDSNGNLLYGKNDLFAALISLKMLSSKTDFNKMFTEIKYAVELLDNNLKTILLDEVLDKMGFPNNWKDIKKV
ncbi:Abi family protein [Solibacillus cecembensis]|uniref:Abi family protein n=1 Tax=Solibacillus cecembensis TaxID=459347 RepID=UPI003D0394FD